MPQAHARWRAGWHKLGPCPWLVILPPAILAGAAPPSHACMASTSTRPARGRRPGRGVLAMFQKPQGSPWSAQKKSGAECPALRL